MTTGRRIALIGVGNDFRHDDAIGCWVVVERLRARKLPPGTRLLMCDSDPGRLIGCWEEADLAVVVDAAHAHPGHPGRVHRLELGIQEVAHSPAASSHGLGLGESVELARVLGRLPGRLVIYAVEGADSSLGRGLSPAVADVVESLVRRVEDEIARHCEATAGG
ncbi:hydrogenase maturation protease [Streptomyces sp. NPDC058572]|uniref:hydrogenase maturation protease n=1 Tax=Streptomyces sp. NPDC058572 TaxID=3346546 RepID=UPI0036505677